MRCRLCLPLLGMFIQPIFIEKSHVEQNNPTRRRSLYSVLICVCVFSVILLARKVSPIGVLLVGLFSFNVIAKSFDSWKYSERGEMTKDRECSKFSGITACTLLCASGILDSTHSHSLFSPCARLPDSSFESLYCSSDHVKKGLENSLRY